MTLTSNMRNDSRRSDALVHKFAVKCQAMSHRVEQSLRSFLPTLTIAHSCVFSLLNPVEDAKVPL